MSRIFVAFLFVLACVVVFIVAFPHGYSPKVASQSEVKTVLRHIFALEEAYFLKHSRYISIKGAENQGYGASLFSNSDSACNRSQDKNLESLEFLIRPCNERNPRYNYRVEVSEDGQSFTATGTTGKGDLNRLYPGCQVADIWSITQENKLTHQLNDPENKASLRKCTSKYSGWF